MQERIESGRERLIELGGLIRERGDFLKKYPAAKKLSPDKRYRFKKAVEVKLLPIDKKNPLSAVVNIDNLCAIFRSKNPGKKPTTSEIKKFIDKEHKRLGVSVKQYCELDFRKSMQKTQRKRQCGSNTELVERMMATGKVSVSNRSTLVAAIELGITVDEKNPDKMVTLHTKIRGGARSKAKGAISSVKSNQLGSWCKLQVANIQKTNPDLQLDYDKFVNDFEHYRTMVDKSISLRDLKDIKQKNPTTLEEDSFDDASEVYDGGYEDTAELDDMESTLGVNQEEVDIITELIEEDIEEESQDSLSASIDPSPLPAKKEVPTLSSEIEDLTGMTEYYEHNPEPKEDTQSSPIHENVETNPAIDDSMTSDGLQNISQKPSMLTTDDGLELVSTPSAALEHDTISTSKEVPVTQEAVPTILEEDTSKIELTESASDDEPKIASILRQKQLLQLDPRAPLSESAEMTDSSESEVSSSRTAKSDVHESPISHNTQKVVEEREINLSENLSSPLATEHEEHDLVIDLTQKAVEHEEIDESLPTESICTLALRESLGWRLEVGFPLQEGSKPFESLKEYALSKGLEIKEEHVSEERLLLKIGCLQEEEYLSKRKCMIKGKRSPEEIRLLKERYIQEREYTLKRRIPYPRIITPIPS